MAAVPATVPEPSQAGDLEPSAVEPSALHSNALEALSAPYAPLDPTTETAASELLGHDGLTPDDQDVEPPLIGQMEASQAIQTGIERAFSLGAPTVVALEGGRGSGKTRLLTHASEFAARLHDGVRVYYGAARQEGDGTYAPFGRLLLECFGVAPASSPSAVRAQMAMVVGEALQGQDAIRMGATTHLLGHIAGVPFPDSPFLGRLEADPGELHRRACAAVRELIEGQAASAPILVLLDNMHHADEHGWDVLRELLKANGHVAVVIAGDEPTARHASALSAAGGVAIGPVGPLSEEDVAAMLYVLIPTLVAAPEPLVSAVTHRSHGNPGAVRALVLALFDCGVFVVGPDGMSVDLEWLASGDDLPITMEDAMRARLARLDDLERATLDRAAVVGEVFWDGAVLGQMRSERTPPGEDQNPLSIWQDDDDEVALARALARLAEKGFIDRVEGSDLPGTREYTFAAAGSRGLLYAEIEETLRTRRHAAVARWLAVVAERQREGVAVMIAPHLERAGLSARAGRAYLEAAAFERTKLRTTMALRLIERALPLIDPDDMVRRIEALHEHGSLLTTVGRYDHGLHAFTEMLRAAWSIGARSKGGVALNRIGRIYRQRGEDEVATEFLTRSLELFRSAGDLRGTADALDDLAQVLRLRGEVDAARQTALEALEIRRTHDDEPGVARSLHTLGTIELALSHLDEAERFFRDALTIRTRLGDHGDVMNGYNGLGIVAFERGDYEEAIHAWQSALEQAREVTDRRSECFLLNNLGEAFLDEGRLAEAEECLTSARELAAALHDRRAAADVERNLGLVAVKRGDDQAEDLLRRARTLAEEYGAKEAIALADRAIGQLRARTVFGDESARQAAEHSFLMSIDTFRELGNEKEVARSLAELGFHLIERGDVDAARERLIEARAIMRRVGLGQLERVERTLLELG